MRSKSSSRIMQCLHSPCIRSSICFASLSISVYMLGWAVLTKVLLRTFKDLLKRRDRPRLTCHIELQKQREALHRGNLERRPMTNKIVNIRSDYGQIRKSE